MFFDFSGWDGSHSFLLQSPDELLEEFSKFSINFCEQLLPNLERKEEHPDLLDMLAKRWLAECDKDGRSLVAPKG